MIKLNFLFFFCYFFIACGTEKENQHPCTSVDMKKLPEDMAYSIDMVIKMPDPKIVATKKGNYFFDPINNSLCEVRNDLTKDRRDLVGKCLPIKTREFKTENTCKYGSDRYFIDSGANYQNDIKITEKDGRFYEAILVNQPISILYTGEYIGGPHPGCSGIMTNPLRVFIVYPNMEKSEILPIFPNLP